MCQTETIVWELWKRASKIEDTSEKIESNLSIQIVYFLGLLFKYIYLNILRLLLVREGVTCYYPILTTIILG